MTGLISEAKALSQSLGDVLIESQQASRAMMSGVHGRRRAGPGEHFWQFRDYQPGEPAQKIDWRRSARGDQLNVRDHEFEAPKTVWFAQDQHSRMLWSGDHDRRTKYSHASLILLTLSDLLLRQGERVGWLGLSDPAARGNSQVDSFARKVVSLEEGLSLDPVQPAQGDLLIVISDFLESPEHWSEDLKRLCAAHPSAGCLIDILDPVESVFPFSGRLTFQTVDGLEKQTIDDVASIREAYLGKLQQRTTLLTSIAKDHGWLSLSHSTSDDCTSIILELCGYLAAKNDMKAA